MVQVQTRERFLALDVFRGMTIAFMIIVNTPGSWGYVYAPLQHAQWNGFTPTDLVFPSFMFAVGNAMSFVMLKWASMSQSQVLLKIFKRTTLIFLLGYLMYWFPFFYLDGQHQIIGKAFSDTRVWGVLQRIGLAYGIAALILYYFKLKPAVWIGVGFLAVYALILIIYGPWEMGHNPVRDLDLWMLGESHMYIDSNIRFDPEGLLSTLPSVTNIIAGFWAGHFIQKKGKTFEGLSQLLLIGFGLLALAFLWNYLMPINKKMWTSTFVLLTVGLDLMILSAIIYYFDFLKFTKGSFFFEVLGKNPLVIYLLSELLLVVFYMIPIGNTTLFTWVYDHIFSNFFGMYLGSFLMAVSYMLLCWSVGYVMDKRKIYIRI